MHDGWCYFNQKASRDHVLDHHTVALAEALAMLDTTNYLPVGFILAAVYADGKPLARASVAARSGKVKEQMQTLKKALLQLIENLDESLALDDG